MFLVFTGVFNGREEITFNPHFIGSYNQVQDATIEIRITTLSTTPVDSEKDRYVVNKYSSTSFSVIQQELSSSFHYHLLLLVFYMSSCTIPLAATHARSVRVITSGAAPLAETVYLPGGAANSSSVVITRDKTANAHGSLMIKTRGSGGTVNGGQQSEFALTWPFCTPADCPGGVASSHVICTVMGWNQVPNTPTQTAPLTPEVLSNIGDRNIDATKWYIYVFIWSFIYH